MDYEKVEELQAKFEELEGWSDTNKFKDLKEKPHQQEQIAAIMFLHSKLKEANKNDSFFLHGEHDVLYIGQDFEIFEDFSEEEVKKCITLGICIDHDADGFQIYASM